MRFLWCDCETTGKEVINSSAFQVAFILVDNGKDYGERCFMFNPLSETILYGEGAGKIHGYTREQIEALPPESEIVPNIAKFLGDAVNLFAPDGSRREKLVFAGYNSNEFDWKHVAAVLGRHGYKMEDYFCGKADVFEQAKAASAAKVLPWLENLKLVTLCKHFRIDMEKAHDAMSDIRATREVAKSLHKLGIPLMVLNKKEQ